MGNELGQRIREARSEADLTAEQLAPKLGVTMGTLLRWERGETKRIGYDQLVAVAKHTGKTVGYFFDTKAAA